MLSVNSVRKMLTKGFKKLSEPQLIKEDCFCSMRKQLLRLKFLISLSKKARLAVTKFKSH